MANVWVVGPVVWIALFLLVVVIVLFVRAARRARRTGDPSPMISITLTVSAFWAALSVLGLLVTLVNTLTASAVTLDVPVREFWPQLPSGVVAEGASATRDGGGFTTAQLSVEGLSVTARVLWAASQALGMLVPATIAALIAVACFQLLAGRAFAPVGARMATITAVVVAVGASVGQVLGQIAGSMASAELFDIGGGRWEEIPGIEDPFAAWIPDSTLSVTFPFWPIAAGLAFAALAAILRYGSRLQRDTEGLV